MSLVRRVAVIILLISCGRAIAHESPVDHVGREMRLWWADGRLHVGYRLLLTERAALLQLNAMDGDGDGKISDDERNSFFKTFANDLAGRFQITIDGKKLTLHPDGDARLDPQLGQNFNFVAEDASLPAGKHAGELLDYYSRSYPGPYRLLSTPTASGSEVNVAAPDEKEGHPGMVIVRFEVVVPTKTPSGR